MDDLIRRGALEMVLLRETAWYDNSDEGVAYAAVQAAPSVDAVEVVHARWKEIRSKGCRTSDWICSACRAFRMHRTKYCPECGARMGAEVISKTETTTREREDKQDG